MSWCFESPIWSFNHETLSGSSKFEGHFLAKIVSILNAFKNISLSFFRFKERFTSIFSFSHLKQIVDLNYLSSTLSLVMEKNVSLFTPYLKVRKRHKIFRNERFMLNEMTWQNGPDSVEKFYRFQQGPFLNLKFVLWPMENLVSFIKNEHVK